MSTNDRIRISLVEDHRATREALAEVIGRAAPIEVVGAYADAESFLAALAGAPPDVLLVDIGLPGMTGIELIARVVEQAPSTRALALTVFEDEGTVASALRAGAFGYLLKDEPMPRLLQAIEEAAAGAHPISSRVAGFLFTHVRRAPVSTPLSEREMELARALAQGFTYAECATRMGIALGTVQDYVKRLYKKLRVKTKREVRDWVERIEAAG